MIFGWNFFFFSTGFHYGLVMWRTCEVWWSGKLDLISANVNEKLNFLCANKVILFLSLSSRLQMSNTFYEAAGQNWFTLDSVHIQYNWTQEATFNASEVYAPATSSYHCQHVSSLHKYDTLLVPSSHTDTSANWHITFTDFQVHHRRTRNEKSFF